MLRGRTRVCVHGAGSPCRLQKAAPGRGEEADQAGSLRHGASLDPTASLHAAAGAERGLVRAIASFSPSPFLSPRCMPNEDPNFSQLCNWTEEGTEEGDRRRLGRRGGRNVYERQTPNGASDNMMTRSKSGVASTARYTAVGGERRWRARSSREEPKRQEQEADGRTRSSRGDTRAPTRSSRSSR